MPDELLNKIRPLDDELVIRDAGNRNVAFRGTINLTVELGTRVEAVPFLVVDRLSTQVILGCDFCDKHVEYIRPRQRVIVMDDGTTAVSYTHLTLPTILLV